MGLNRRRNKKETAEWEAYYLYARHRWSRFGVGAGEVQTTRLGK